MAADVRQRKILFSLTFVQQRKKPRVQFHKFYSQTQIVDFGENYMLKVKSSESISIFTWYHQIAKENIIFKAYIFFSMRGKYRTEHWNDTHGASTSNGISVDITFFS